MKKFFNFILSFIAPKKMEVHREMSIFIAFLIFLACALLSAGVPALRLNSLLKNKYVTECYAFDGTYSSEMISDFDLSQLPSFELNSSNEAKGYGEATNQVFDIAYKNSNDETINLKIIYAFGVDRNTNLADVDLGGFDLNEYLSFIPFNEDHTLKQRDVLVVYTKDILYYIFNHGYTLGYMNNSEANLEDYHYINIPTWVGVNNWTLYEAKLDADGNLVKDASGEIIYKTDTDGNKIYKTNLNELFTCGSNTSIGIFSYLELQEADINFNELSKTTPLFELTDIIIYSCESSVKLYSFILSIFYNFLLPLLWIFVMWLILHKGGELTRFREYYAICACTMILPSIITAIVGLFIPFTIFAKFSMIVEAVWFFIVVSIINSMKRQRTKVEEPKVEEEATVEEEVKTQEISEIKEEQKEEEESRVARIG